MQNMALEQLSSLAGTVTLDVIAILIADFLRGYFRNKK
jgi:hypothetical protein